VLGGSLGLENRRRGEPGDDCLAAAAGLGLRRAGRSVRPTRTRVSSMCARRRFRRAQTTMEVGGAMSSPRGCQWRVVELGRRLGVRARQRPGRSTYSWGRSVVSG
jgi:hypothetical protein